MTIKRIITLENTKNLKLEHITNDFEKGLINAIISVFLFRQKNSSLVATKKFQ